VRRWIPASISISPASGGLRPRPSERSTKRRRVRWPNGPPQELAQLLLDHREPPSFSPRVRLLASSEPGQGTKALCEWMPVLALGQGVERVAAAQAHKKAQTTARIRPVAARPPAEVQADEVWTSHRCAHQGGRPLGCSPSGVASKLIAPVQASKLRGVSRSPYESRSEPELVTKRSVAMGTATLRGRQAILAEARRDTAGRGGRRRHRILDSGARIRRGEGPQNQGAVNCPCNSISSITAVT
jgi:hypothetical protein